MLAWKLNKQLQKPKKATYGGAGPLGLLVSFEPLGPTTTKNAKL